jgi:hypothetical protein
MESVDLLAETKTSWIFSIANMVNIESDDEETSQTLQQVDNAMAKHLFTDIIIDKASSQIKALKIYAKSSFKPSLMLSIEKFELRLNFTEAWPNGPFIRKNMTRHIKGNYGWLFSLDDLVTTELTMIEKVSFSKGF